MKAFFGIFRILFFVFMALFLVGGVAVIGIQTLGIVTANGEMVAGVKDWLNPGVFGAATACAVCALVLNYSPTHRDDYLE